MLAWSLQRACRFAILSSLGRRGRKSGYAASGLARISFGTPGPSGCLAYPSDLLNWEHETVQPESVCEHSKPATTYSLLAVLHDLRKGGSSCWYLEVITFFPSVFPAKHAAIHVEGEKEVFRGRRWREAVAYLTI